MYRFHTFSNFSWTEGKEDSYKRMQKVYIGIVFYVYLYYRCKTRFGLGCSAHTVVFGYIHSICLSYANIPSKLLQKELYVAFPVTAPSLAGFCLTVFTENPSGPITSTSTIW